MGRVSGTEGVLGERHDHAGHLLLAKRHDDQHTRLDHPCHLLWDGIVEQGQLPGFDGRKTKTWAYIAFCACILL
jgi:hypothetical protein